MPRSEIEKYIKQKGVTLLITTFNRDGLLASGLASIGAQNLPIEIFVLNDGAEGNAKKLAGEYGATYIYTGLTKRSVNDWRVPGFALNIGVKKSKSEIIIISCAEIIHLKDCLRSILEPVIEDEMALGIPLGFDDPGKYDIEKRNCQGLPPLNVKLPFLMAMRRQRFLEIGGYDEDYLGIGREDVDIVDRLLNRGCYFEVVDAICVHKKHKRVWDDPASEPRKQYNRDVYNKKKGTIVRNQGREWGKADWLKEQQNG